MRRTAIIAKFLLVTAGERKREKKKGTKNKTLWPLILHILSVS